MKPKKKKRKENTRERSAFNPKSEFYNPYKARFARNVLKQNPNQRYLNRMNILDSRAMKRNAEFDPEVTLAQEQQRQNRAAIPKRLLQAVALGLLGKGAAKGTFASLIYPNQGPL